MKEIIFDWLRWTRWRKSRHAYYAEELTDYKVVTTEFCSFLLEFVKPDVPTIPFFCAKEVVQPDRSQVAREATLYTRDGPLSPLIGHQQILCER